MPQWVRENEALYCSCIAGAISEQQYVRGLKQAGLADVEVRERIVYEHSQLKDLLKSELVETVVGQLAGSIDGATLDDWAAELDGKIWSANFYARKPG